MSFAGVFQSMRLRTYPTGPLHFSVVTTLYGGEGRGIMQLVATRLETEEDVYWLERPIAFAGHGQAFHYEMVIRKLVLPAPGRYMFSLRLNGEELANRPLDVGREGGTP